MTYSLKIVANNAPSSYLAILGVIAAAFATTATVCIGLAVVNIADSVLNTISSSAFYVYADASNSKSLVPSISTQQLLEARRLPNVLSFVPAVGFGGTVLLGSRTARFSYGGESSVPFFNHPLMAGRRINSLEVSNAARVAVLSPTGARKIKATTNDVGRQIILSGMNFRIIGIQRPEPEKLLPEFVSESDVYVPYTTFEQLFLHGQAVTVARGLVRNTTELVETARHLVHSLHATSSEGDNYAYATPREYGDVLRRISHGVRFSMNMIATVSGAMAAVGIFTTMLISVAARKREFGVRRAIGSTRRAILSQVLGEAATMALIGTGIGAPFGVAFASAVATFILKPVSGIEPSVPWDSALAAAVGFASILSLLSGAVPAWRASMLDPIECLRTEQ